MRRREDAANDEGLLLPRRPHRRRQLQRRLLEHGLHLLRLGPHQVVHQCGSGVTACHNLLAMEAAGFPGSRLYAGSWSEWCADPARPVATGPG